MLRITCCEVDGILTMELAGRVAGEWVTELRRAAHSRRPTDGLRLDLSGVLYADADGVRLLRELRRQGAELLGCSEFMAVLLNGGSEWHR